MILETGRKTIAFLLIMLTTGLLTAGCGKKAPPRPPGGEAAPAAVGNLSKAISGKTLSLTWSLIAGQAENVAGFYVYRSKMRPADSDCRSCPILFERMAVIPQRGQGAGNAARRTFEYQETLEEGYRYIYKVAAYSPNGLTGKDSNTVEFDR